MTTADYEANLHDAERALKEARSAEDVRQAWRRHVSVLGHRTLGRLLTGRPADELLDRRLERLPDPQAGAAQDLPTEQAGGMRKRD